MAQRTITTELPSYLYQFASDVSRLVYPARCEYLKRLLAGEKDSVIIKEIQPKYGINKRMANGIRSEVKAAIVSAKKCQCNHIKLLKSKISSIKAWLKENQKKLEKIPNVSDLKTKRNRRSQRKFAIHHKKRKLYQLEKKLEHAQEKPLQVTLGQKKTNYYTVGSKGESYGNQIAQYDGQKIIFRVPYALEKKYGKYIHAPLQFEYERGQAWIEDALKNNRALTYRIYVKEFRWFIACSTDVEEKARISYSRHYGCVGIDINPSVIGYAVTDREGNLKVKGQIKLNLHSKRKNQQLAIIHNVVNQIVQLATLHQCPIVLENLDFTAKKAKMKEQGKKYSRMLSSFSYGKMIELITQKAELAGIELIKVSPAYSSVIGLVKFMKQYGLSSDTAAALTIARRAMRLSERIPTQNAYPVMIAGKHVWAAWNVLHKKLNKKLCLSRHKYFSLSNGQLEVMLSDEFFALVKKGSCSKRKRTSKSG